MRVNTDTAAQILGIAPITLKRWRADDKGPAYYRRGRFIEYDVKDLEAYEERIVPSESAAA